MNLKLLILPQPAKKKSLTNLTINQIVSYQLFQRYLKNLYMNKQKTVVNMILSPKLRGFEKRRSSQNAFLNLLSNWDIFRDIWSCADRINGPQYGIWMSSSWPSCCKLAAYSFDKTGLSIITDFLKNRKQRVKKVLIFSSYLDILSGIPQGSMLGLILFNPSSIILCFSLMKQKSVILPMILAYIYVQIKKYLITCIFF